jgi:pantothenate kinase
MTITLDHLCQDILKRAGNSPRYVIAVAGPPGAGKSTLSEALAARLSELAEPSTVLPMDGFHMDNAVLEQKGRLKRKGAPDTFDLRGFTDVLKAVREGSQEVLSPVFDRSRELAIAAARVISPDHRFIVAEGNYLLLKQGRWADLRPLFDLAILLAPPFEELERRLTERWRYYGLTGEALDEKLNGNDLPNVRLVLSESGKADIILPDWTA